MQGHVNGSVMINRLGDHIRSRRGLAVMVLWYVLVSGVVFLLYRSGYTETVLLPEAYRILSGELPCYNLDPGLPVLLAPLLWAFGEAGLPVAVLLFAVLYAFAVWYFFGVLWMRGAEIWKRAATLVTIPLLLLLPPYAGMSGSLMQQAPFMAFSLIGIAFIIKAEHNGTPADAFGAGICLSAANYFDYLWMPAPFFLMAWYLLARRPRSAGWAATVMIIMLLTQIPLLVITQANSGEWSLHPPQLGNNLIEGNFPPIISSAGSYARFSEDPDSYIKDMTPDEQLRWGELSTAGKQAETELEREKAKRAAFLADFSDNTRQYAGVIAIKMPALLLGIPGWNEVMHTGGGMAALWWVYRIMHVMLMVLYLMVSWSLLRDATSLLFMGLYVCLFLFAFPLVSDAILLLAVTPLAYWVAVAGGVKAWMEYRDGESLEAK